MANTLPNIRQREAALRPEPAFANGKPDHGSHLFTGPPLFISGCNRGGTTILSQLLSAHPEVRNVGRGAFNEGQYIWRRRYPDWSRHRWALPPWRWFLRRTAADATPRTLELFRAAFTEAIPAPGRMLEKTPANAMRIPLIDRIYPNSRFIHVLRDGRYTSASLIARGVWPALAPHQWVGAHRTAIGDLRALPPERLILVRYEELVADPSTVLERVCRRCDLNWGAAERHAVLLSARERLRPAECRWSRFPDAQKGYILRVIGELQRELGYPVEY